MELRGKEFSIEATAREIMLEHMPPMKPGRQGEEHLVLDALALYQAVKDGLREAWCDGETAGMVAAEEARLGKGGEA